MRLLVSMLMCISCSSLVFSEQAFKELSLERSKNSTKVSGEHFQLTIDPHRGGLITSIKLFDGSLWNEILDQTFDFPNLIFRNQNQIYNLISEDVEISNLQQTSDCISFTITSKNKPFVTTLNYEIYNEGAIFLEFALDLNVNEFDLAEAKIELNIAPEIINAAKYRNDQLAKDERTTHFETARIAFGVNPEKSYTNEIEVLVQSKNPIAGNCSYNKDNSKFTWSLGSGKLNKPYHYENLIAIALGSAATGKPKTNLIAQRPYHWVNFIDTKNWFPTNKQIDEMVLNKATMLIMHHEWMLNRGSNCNPHADYAVARDHNELIRTISYAHEKGMRVALYMRGVEMYGLNAKFFEKYLKRDWDGIYVDWHGPSGISYHEANFKEDALGGKHFSTDGTYLPLKEYFLFTKKLRDVVGNKGFLIGHQGSFNTGIFANLVFDAYLPGETKSDRDMFNSVDNITYKGMMGSNVCMPWPEESPVFRSPEGASKMAACGLYPHLLMGFKIFSLKPDDQIHQPILEYWRILSNVDAEKVRAFNLPSENSDSVKCSDPNVKCVVYQESTDKYLLVLTNLGVNTADASLYLNKEILGLQGSYKVFKVDAGLKNTEYMASFDDYIQITGLKQWQIMGFLLTK